MTFNCFIPSDLPSEKVTHLGIGAHQDDLEIMALHGILECYQNPKQHFGGIICTNGSGSPRAGTYADYTDEKMKQLRREEQRQAAEIGKYLFITQLDFTSSDISSKLHHHLVKTLYHLLSTLHPKVIYTHNPLDKHPTHRAVCRAVIEALRQLPVDQHPQRLLGSEVWRNLDWINDQDKVILDVSSHPQLSEKLISVFESQISGGKRYDLAAVGRRYSNATFSAPHCVDQSTQACYAIDLMPLLKNHELTLREFALGFVERFRCEVEQEHQI